MSTAENSIDVRTIVPPERHPKIFGAYNNLNAGESFVLINDHDPKPLFYQFQNQHGDKFGWDYLESGPVWRVRISKKAA